MQHNKDHLFKIISKFGDYSVLIIGDIILDEYIWGNASRLSPEAPVPILEVKKYSHIPGGAANVASNVATLKGKAVLIGVVGNDHQAELLVKSLEEHNINSKFIIKDNSRPTTVKTRLIAHNHQLTRADREVKTPIGIEIEEKIMLNVEEAIGSIDLVLLSDYAKGVLTPSLIKRIIGTAKRENKPVLVDPKGLELGKYSEATIITPNRLEAELATKSPSGTPPEILAKLVKTESNVEHILVTLGEEGILLYSLEQFKKIPAVTSEVFDVTGAGDSLISTIALALTAGDGDLETAIALGNYAAGVAVRKIGTTTVLQEELKHIIEHDLIDSKAENAMNNC